MHSYPVDSNVFALVGVLLWANRQEKLWRQFHLLFGADDCVDRV